MQDPTEAASGDGPATPRRGGPRHAAPAEDAAPETSAPAWHPPVAPAAGSRAAHRRHAGRTSVPRSRRRLLALGVALVALVAVPVVLVGVLVRDDDADAGTAGSAATGPDGSAADAATAPLALVDWLRTELPEGGTVTAEPEVRAALLRAGTEDDVLPESLPADADAATPALALVETAPEGSRLVARFDRDGAAPLLLVDPAPVEATGDQRRQRETLAAAVLANPTTRAEPDPREVLAAADVDARLLALVAALTAQDGLGVGAFPVPPGEEAGTAPARRVVVDALGGRPVPADGAATQRLVAWLEAQLAPFAPDTVEVTGDGVLIGFDYVPGPEAVVSAATP